MSAGKGLQCLSSGIGACKTVFSPDYKENLASPNWQGLLDCEVCPAWFGAVRLPSQRKIGCFVGFFLKEMCELRAVQNHHVGIGNLFRSRLGKRVDKKRRARFLILKKQTARFQNGFNIGNGGSVHHRPRCPTSLRSQFPSANRPSFS